LGSFILRCLHLLLWWSHAGFLYVDDFFFIFPKKVAWIMACLCCILAQVLNIPISWRKIEFGPRVQWIGWQFHVTAGYISLPSNKIDKLSDYISSMLKTTRTSKKSLEKLVGLLNWVTQIFLLMRCWLPIIYRDLYYIPASHYSIDLVTGRMLLIVLMTIWFSFENLLAQEFQLGARYLLFATKQSIAKLIFINFTYLNVEPGCVLKTPTPFDGH